MIDPSFSIILLLKGYHLRLGTHSIKMLNKNIVIVIFFILLYNKIRKYSVSANLHSASAPQEQSLPPKIVTKADKYVYTKKAI